MVEVKSQFVQVGIIRIYHECEGGIAIKSLPHSAIGWSVIVAIKKMAIRIDCLQPV